MIIKIHVRLLKDDPCYVRNYRRGNVMETGTVTKVTVGINKDKSYRVSYEVMLDRRTTGRSKMYPDGGAPIFLTVNDDVIQSII